jgi:hypothetical protein
MFLLFLSNSHNRMCFNSFSLKERKFGNLGFSCFGAIGNKVCNFLPMRSSAGLFSLARGTERTNVFIIY